MNSVAREIISGLNNYLPVRQYSRTFLVPNAESLGVPELGADFGDLTWSAELATGSEDSTMDFHRRDLRPHPMARRIRVSNKLLGMAEIAPENFIRKRTIRVAGQVQEYAFLTGNGQNRPSAFSLRTPPASIPTATFQLGTLPLR